MKLKEESVRRYLEGHGASNCATCGQNNWTYDPTVYEIREFTGGGLVIGGNTALLPVLTVTCSNCGTMKLINSIAAKLLSKDGTPL
jgi:hypothetical protein